MNKQTPDYSIFISYRRAGGAQFARILKAELEKRGYLNRVFMDYDELKDGKFDKRIMDAIESAPIFIFILSPRSLDRCNDQDDWVRKEIEYAVARNRHIIPVNFDNLFDGFPKNIPPTIHEVLGQHQFSKIDSEQLLNASIEQMIRDRIASIVAPDRPTSRSDAGADIAILPDADCKVLRFQKLLATVPANSQTFIKLLKGNHLLEFVSTEFPEIKEQLRYSVPDNDYSDFIEVRLKARIEEKLKEKIALIPVQDSTGKWGYIDKTGKLLIPCIYDITTEFHEALACVMDSSRKYGFINKNGKTVIPCIYKDAHDFSGGLAAVTEDYRHWGFIDKNGNQVIPNIYRRVGDFNDSIAAVENDSFEMGYINTDGHQVIPFIYKKVKECQGGMAIVKESDYYGVIDKSGKQMIPFIYKEIYFNDDDLLRVKDTSNKYGFVDRKGNPVIPCIYNTAYTFSEGLSLVRDASDLYGFIDKKGKQVIPCNYHVLHPFTEGLARVFNQNRFGYIDKKGQLKIGYLYRSAGPFSEGLALVQDPKTEKYGYIDKTGKVAIPLIHEEVKDFHDGIAAVSNNGKWGLIDKRGNLVVPCIYSDIKH